MLRDGLKMLYNKVRETSDNCGLSAHGQIIELTNLLHRYPEEKGTPLYGAIVELIEEIRDNSGDGKALNTYGFCMRLQQLLEFSS